MPEQRRQESLGFLRLKQIIAPSGLIPVSRSTWYSWVAAGKAPKPIKIGPHITLWSVEDIIAFAQRLKAAGPQERPD